MNEPEFGNKVRHALNRGTQLEPRIETRLREAREHALAQGGRDTLRASAGARVGRRSGLLRLSLTVVLPAVLLGVALTVIYGWQQNQKAAEFADIDSRLLAGDLPIDAYLDKGFDAWLKQHGAR
jgi:hypothetical protein